ncbi:hypothetical protein DdX_08582 [Ditylenchus destructor]|uniref:Nucleolar protein 8 n=1 Tax=Ditylenchus destructor TaxID=166010 RepID=A0AAD4R755_9BILA|nr:hypothetical protein DdX_08582 [Ditylenchus destructor]
MSQRDDERFHLDERFIDGAEEDDEHENKLDKRRKEFDILSNVLGKRVRSTLLDEASQKIIRPFSRFDPTDPTHIQWMEEQKKLQNPEFEDEGRPVATSSAKAEETARQTEFAHMDPKFVEELKQKSSKTPGENGFSFLSSIGRPDVTPPQEKLPKISLNNVPALNGMTSLISSTSAKTAKSDEDPTSWLKDVLDSGHLTDEQKEHPIFSVHMNLPEIHSVVSSFMRVKVSASTPQASKKWKEMREKFVNSYKSRRKAAVKNLREKEAKPWLTDSKSKDGARKSIEPTHKQPQTNRKRKRRTGP